MRLLKFLVLALVIASALPAAAEEGAHSPNITHLQNIKQERRDGTTPTAGQGSDLEFMSVDVTGLPEAVERGVEGVRNFALGGSLANGMQIVDITDPTAATTVSVWDCRINQGDIQVFTRADGHTYATFTQDSTKSAASANSPCYIEAKAAGFAMGSNNGTFIVDLTNPYAPAFVSFIAIAKGSHNQTVHPSGMVMYNSNNELAAGQGIMEIIDIADVRKPKQVGTLALTTGIDSHDITFSADGKRAYSAAISHTLIFDTSNPLAPTIIGRIVDPSMGIQHQADPVTITDPILGTRTYLAVTDEFGGGSAGSLCPGGAVHIFDITGALEKNPVKVGVWEAPTTKPAGGGQEATGSALGCTSHVLRFHPAEKIMTIAWYNAGIHVVDISGLMGVSAGLTSPLKSNQASTGSLGAGMKELGYYFFPNSNTWSVKTNQIAADGSMYLYGNDINRGMDVYKFRRPGAGEVVDFGSWTAPEVYAQRVGVRTPTDLAGMAKPFCMLTPVQV